MVTQIAGSRTNIYLFIVYRSPATNDRVFDCILGALGRIQSEDPMWLCLVFCSVGDINCHHSNWLGSNRMDSHGVAALDFATLMDCTQIFRGPTHRAGGVLDLVLTNVPELCRCRWWSCWSLRSFSCSVAARHFGLCTWFWRFSGHSLENSDWLDCSQGWCCSISLVVIL